MISSPSARPGATAGGSARIAAALIAHARPIGLVAMVILAALVLVWPILRLPFHMPIGPNEGWNALHAAQAVGGGALYPARGSFMVNNYPPLSFYVLGWVGTALGDAVIAGRLLSLLALLVIALNIALTVRAFGAARWAAAFAGLLFVAVMGKSYTLYVGVNDPQLLAHAVMTAGFLVFVARPRRFRTIAAAAALMVVAGFIKHNIIAMPLAVTTWLLVYDRRSLVQWLAVGVGLVLAGFALCLWAYGGDVLIQLTAPRSYDLMRVVRLLGWVQTIVLPVAMWAVFAIQAPRRGARLRLLDHLMVAGILAFVVTRTGDGVSVNAMFDWIIAAGIAAGVILPRLADLPLFRRQRRAVVEAVVIAALCLRIVLLPQHELVALVAGSHGLAELRAASAATDRVAALMRAQPEPALCEDLALCYWSGHASAYDMFNAGQAVLTGARDLGDLDRRIANGEFGVIQVNGGSPLLATARAAMARCEPTVRGEICYGRRSRPAAAATPG